MKEEEGGEGKEVKWCERGRGRGGEGGETM